MLWITFIFQVNAPQNLPCFTKYVYHSRLLCQCHVITVLNKSRSRLWYGFPLGIVHKCRFNGVKIKSVQSNDKTLPFHNPPLEHNQKASNLMDKQGIVWSRTKPGALKCTIINIDTGIFHINCMPPLSSPSIQSACHSMLASLHSTSLFVLINSVYQWWSVTKYNYFVTVLKYIFQVSVLYWSSFILSNFYFYFTTFQSIRSYFLLHYIS